VRELTNENCKLKNANCSGGGRAHFCSRRRGTSICNLHFSFLIFQLLFSSFSAGFQARAAEPLDPEKSADKMITPAGRRGIDQGLQRLASRQNGDGGFGTGAMRGNAAICGLSGMAFLAAGSTPGRGPYGDRVQRAVDYLLANSQPSGLICESPPDPRSKMYSHGFATLFLAECYGMSPRRELRDKLRAAVNLIVKTQNSEGGWRYEPQIVDHADISVTVCQVIALRAAHNAGVYVPAKTFNNAVDYVVNSQNPDGGFVYQLANRGQSAFARSAAAVVALNSAGIYSRQGSQRPEVMKNHLEDEKKHEAVKKGLEYLDQFRPEPGVVRRGMEYYEYGHYYAVQAMWQAGGGRWARWYPAVRDELLRRQLTNGSWDSAFGAEYATAMCLLVLQMPENQLPIFQR
jgi:hypothetical protein